VSGRTGEEEADIWVSKDSVSGSVSNRAAPPAAIVVIGTQCAIGPTLDTMTANGEFHFVKIHSIKMTAFRGIISGKTASG
jgi:hypothetical protein